jgi:hypothetical protein
MVRVFTPSARTYFLEILESRRPLPSAMWINKF